MQIHKEATYPVGAERVFETLTNSAMFAAATGKPATIDAAEGGVFTIFGGYVEGRQIEAVPNERLVQAWRFPNWEPGVYSTVRFTLSKEATGTRLSVDQTGHPAEWHEHLSTNWPVNYLDPIARSFTQNKGENQ